MAHNSVIVKKKKTSVLLLAFLITEHTGQVVIKGVEVSNLKISAALKGVQYVNEKMPLKRKLDKFNSGKVLDFYDLVLRIVCIIS